VSSYRKKLRLSGLDISPQPYDNAVSLGGMLCVHQNRPNHVSPLFDTRRRGFWDCPPARVLRVLTAAAIMPSSVSSPPTSEHSPPAIDVQKIQRAVSVCVNFVRTLPEEYWGVGEFDAHYNTATGRVLRLGTPQAAVQFDKCMAD
jgi:hypothetical protein